MTQIITVWGVLAEDGDKEIRLGGRGRPDWYEEKGKEVYEALKAVLAPAVMESLVREFLAEQGMGFCYRRGLGLAAACGDTDRGGDIDE